jgi:hypothetical protein
MIIKSLILTIQFVNGLLTAERRPRMIVAVQQPGAAEQRLERTGLRPAAQTTLR